MDTNQRSNELLKDIRILVAEDNPINQKVIQKALQLQQATVEVVGNGQLAVDRLREQTYDILLIDLHMPVMDGETATRYIRDELKSDIPIFAITADVVKENAEQYKAMGMDGYILKPFNFNDLYERILQQLKKA